MQPRILTAVMAHAGGQAAYDRHWRYWERNSNHVVTYCPHNSLAVNPCAEVVQVGEAAHSGHDALYRFKAILRDIAARDNWDFCVLQEYDSLCLSEAIPQRCFEWPDALWANFWFNNSNDGKFKSQWYLHPPLVMSRRVLNELLEAARLHPGEDEHGFWDRWIGWMTWLGCIPISPFNNMGASYNTLNPGVELDWAVGRVANHGAVMIHGVKTEQILNALIEARARWKATS